MGWREFIGLPDLNVAAVKAKVDSGARTSTLHAEDIEIIRRRRRDKIYFTVYPEQKSKKKRVRTEAWVFDYREVKSSVGHATQRPVIQTTVELGDEVWPIELTLVNRDIMGFRMLLGRQAIRGHFLIDPGRSYLQSRSKGQPSR